MSNPTLDELVLAAREADPSERIMLRDSIAAFDDEALDAVADLLSDRRLAAFAVRVLEQIGRDPATRDQVLAILSGVDTTDWPAYLIEDRDRSLAALGYKPLRSPNSMARASSDRPPGRPGRQGRGYWVMRTSPWERPFLWAEAKEGRLRQGWGVEDEQNLEVIAEAIRSGRALTPLQQESRRALRMLASWHNGMHLGDVVVAPNLPVYGRLSAFRVAGSYYWSPVASMTFGERFGHVLPVELLIADVDRWSTLVTAALRGALRGQNRLYNITGYGGEVDYLIGEEVSTVNRHHDHWTDADYAALFDRFPPENARPTDSDADDLALELGRTRDAIRWQWEDGAAYVQGRSASTTSQQLMTWLDRHFPTRRV